MKVNILPPHIPQFTHQLPKKFPGIPILHAINFFIPSDDRTNSQQISPKFYDRTFLSNSQSFSNVGSTLNERFAVGGINFSLCKLISFVDRKFQGLIGTKQNEILS